MDAQPITNLSGVEIPGAFQINPFTISDTRGFFSRVIDVDTISSLLKVQFQIVKIYNSCSIKKNTFRGFHSQSGKYAETKIFKCIKGRITNFIFDNRINSPTFQTIGILNLNSHNRLLSVVPKGCLNALLSSTDYAEVIYFTDNIYAPDFEYGMKYNDKILNDLLSSKELILSEKDQSWPDFVPGCTGYK